MAKIFYPDFFNDVFGPIMQPGSSGGFAGPARIGNIAGKLLDEKIKSVIFSFQPEDIGRFKSLGNFMRDLKLMTKGFLMPTGLPGNRDYPMNSGWMTMITDIGEQ